MRAELNEFLTNDEITRVSPKETSTIWIDKTEDELKQETESAKTKEQLRVDREREQYVMEEGEVDYDFENAEKLKNIKKKRINITQPKRK